MIEATLFPFRNSQTKEKPIKWHASCAWNGEGFTALSRYAPSYELCRWLVAAGCPDDTMELRKPNGFLMGTIKSIHYAATRTIEEGNGTIHEKRYVPPGARFSHGSN